VTDQSPSQRAYIRTLPAVLTGVAAVVTAVATLAGVLMARDGGNSAGTVAATEVHLADVEIEPAEGVVGDAYVAGARDGPRTLTLHGPVRQLWAFFRFTTLPERGRAVSVRWRTPGGKLGPPIAKERVGRIVAHVQDREPLARGVWHALLYVDDVVVKDVRVEVAGSPSLGGPTYGADR
jgi:hypothetical protein